MSINIYSTISLQMFGKPLLWKNDGIGKSSAIFSHTLRNFTLKTFLSTRCLRPDCKPNIWSRNRQRIIFHCPSFKLNHKKTSHFFFLLSSNHWIRSHLFWQNPRKSFLSQRHFLAWGCIANEKSKKSWKLKDYRKMRGRHDAHTHCCTSSIKIWQGFLPVW